MKYRMLITVALGSVCGFALWASIYSPKVSAQTNESHTPVYNPYPPGILPPDLSSEIARVLREVDLVEGRAIERWHSLPPPTRLGTRPGPNPPVLKGTGTESIET